MRTLELTDLQARLLLQTLMREGAISRGDNVEGLMLTFALEDTEQQMEPGELKDLMLKFNVLHAQVGCSEGCEHRGHEDTINLKFQDT